MKKLFKNNKGFSYAEMLLVLAIMAIMTGFATISIGTVYRNNTGRIADQLYSAFYQTRSNAMTNGTKKGWITFVNKDGNVYYHIGERVSPEVNGYFESYEWKKLCGDNIIFGVGDGYDPLVDGDAMMFGFDQATGKYLDYAIYNRSIHATTMFSELDIVVFVETKNHKNKETLQLDHVTGKIFRGFIN